MKKDCLEIFIKDQKVLISIEDVQILVDYGWHLHYNRDKLYIRGWNKSTKKKVMMHRLITNAPKNLIVDHINRNTLDNRRENLRICDQSQNIMNRGISKNNTSGHKGVAKFKNKWIAYIGANNEKIHLGTFKTKEEASIAFNKAAVKYHGEFAVLNTTIKENCRP
jgi:hypothetical protein